MAAVLDVAETASDGLDEVFGGAEGDVGEPAAPQQGPDAFDGVEVGCVGRQVADGRPVLGCRPFPQVGGLVDVEIVPEQDDRSAELPVCGDQQVTVVTPGKTLAGIVTLLGVWLPDGASGRGGFGSWACGQAVVGRSAAPVIWSQIAKRMLISARWVAAVIRCRRGRKWGEMPLNADRNRWAPPTEWKPFIARSRCLVGWWLFSARLLRYFD